MTGLHIIAGFHLQSDVYLQTYSEWKAFAIPMVHDLHLNIVGEVHHDFTGGGFTSVICLTESHLSLHTYPELKYAAFDVYLSNYTKDNSLLTKELYERTCLFFTPNDVDVHYIHR